MIETTVSDFMPVSVEVAYSYLRNLETMKDYNFSILSCSWVDPNQKKQCKISVSLTVFSVEGIYSIESEEPPYSFRAVLEDSNLRIEDIYTLQEVDGKTKLTITDKTSLKGFLKWSEPLAQGLLKQGMEKNFQTLKQQMEKLAG